MFVFNPFVHDARVLKEAKTLTEAGHDVRVVAFLTDEAAAYEEKDGFRIYRVALDPIHRKMLRLILLPARLAMKLVGSQHEQPVSGSVGMQAESVASGESQGQRPSNVSIPYPLRWTHELLYRILVFLVNLLPNVYLSYLDYYYRSFRQARQEPADIYHAHDLNTLPVAWLCSRLAKGQLVYDSHELWLDRNRPTQRSRLNAQIVRRIERFLVRRADAVITVSQSIANVLSGRYGISQPTVVMNTPDYHPVERCSLLRDEMGIPQGHRIVLYVGRITFNRGIEELLQSLRYLNGCSLVLMGYRPDNYVADLKRFIESEGLTERVHFFGPVPFEEVPKYAASADIGVVLFRNVGLSYYYSSPNKLFECMAAGLPVVGSNFPDLKRYIEGYNFGVTCDPDNPRDIADAINYILSDECRYNQMRDNALEAAKVFNWQNESRKLLTLYEGLSSRKND